MSSFCIDNLITHKSSETAEVEEKSDRSDASVIRPITKHPSESRESNCHNQEISYGESLAAGSGYQHFSFPQPSFGPMDTGTLGMSQIVAAAAYNWQSTGPLALNLAYHPYLASE